MLETKQDQERTEFGFHTTACHCAACIRQCEHISGALIPQDLPRWRLRFGVKEDIELVRILLASPGAIVARDGVLFRIQTIVPDRSKDGACVFLNSAKRCMIHPVAPFSCRFFDEHMTESDRANRSRTGLIEVMKDWQEGGPYSQLWLQLHGFGRIAEAPEVLRERIARCPK